MHHVPRGGVISPATPPDPNSNGVWQGKADEDLEKGQTCGDAASDHAKGSSSSTKFSSGGTITRTNSLRTASATEGDVYDGEAASLDDSCYAGIKPGQGVKTPSGAAILSVSEKTGA
jgi:hypothetical protein